MERKGKEEILQLMEQGEITVEGLFNGGSNYTFLVQLTGEGETFKAVYKPNRGEQPLYDFPPKSLARREVAAWYVSEALGWELVPPTVYRKKKAPLGAGSLQLFMEHDPNYHTFVFTLEDKVKLKPFVVFDLLTNNADRKASHIVKDLKGHLWGIDHGLCFHPEPKLRTVLWDFIGEPIPEDLLGDVATLVAGLESVQNPAEIFGGYLHTGELRAMERRAKYLLESKRFPAPDGKSRPYPFPPV